MRISNGYPDAFIGCAMFPEEGATDEFGFGFDVPAPPLQIYEVGSGLDDPEPPPLDPNNPADQLKVKSGL
jgi:hypothetical protein